MQTLYEYEHGIFAIDSGYQRPLLAAIHLIVESGRIAIVDTGVNASFPRVESALKHLGFSHADVDYVLLTHVHLDHAGGAGTMMQNFPHAQCIVHPRGARHMIDPSKLVSGVNAVYGAENVKRMYGNIIPIAAEQIKQAVHEEIIELAGRKIYCLDTPGHARHHLCFHDIKSQSIFSGDMFGLSYREMDIQEANGQTRQFIFPTTTPVQFEPDEMHRSIDLLLSKKPAFIYNTHFGQINHLQAKGESLHRLVQQHCEIALQSQKETHTADSRLEEIRHGLTKLLLTEAQDFGSTMSESALRELWGTDLKLNAQGLDVWLDAVHSQNK